MKKKIFRLFLFLLCFLGTLSFLAQTFAKDKEKTVLQQVLYKGTIRCGYVISAPFLLQDPNTKKLSGIAYDFMESIARELELQLDWTEETGWGTFHEGLNGGRYDVMCVPVYLSGARARVASLTKPLFYNSLYATARADDMRFDKGGIETINRQNIRVAVLDGDVTQSIRRTLFPLAQEIAAPQLSDESHILLSVATKKADIGFENLDGLRRYNEGATVKLKVALGGKPVRFFANSLAVKLGEVTLRDALNVAIEAINNDGITKQILGKYGENFRATAN